MGGWYSWQKEPRAAHWFFLISDKKRNLQINKNGHFEKKGNFREPVAKFEKIASLVFDKKTCVYKSKTQYLAPIGPSSVLLDPFLISFWSIPLENQV